MQTRTPSGGARQVGWSEFVTTDVACQQRLDTGSSAIVGTPLPCDTLMPCGGLAPLAVRGRRRLAALVAALPIGLIMLSMMAGRWRAATAGLLGLATASVVAEPAFWCALGGGAKSHQ